MRSRDVPPRQAQGRAHRARISPLFRCRGAKGKSQFVREQADPLLGLGALEVGAAAEFRAAVRPLEKLGCTERGDEDVITGFVQTIDECFHSAPIYARGVGQWQGERREGPSSKLKVQKKPHMPGSKARLWLICWRLSLEPWNLI